MIEIVKREGNRQDMQGLSTDTKPLLSARNENLDAGSTFLELNLTQKLWIFSPGNINPATTNGWWEVV